MTVGRVSEWTSPPFRNNTYCLDVGGLVYTPIRSFILVRLVHSFGPFVWSIHLVHSFGPFIGPLIGQIRPFIRPLTPPHPTVNRAS